MTCEGQVTVTAIPLKIIEEGEAASIAGYGVLIKYLTKEHSFSYTYR